MIGELEAVFNVPGHRGLRHDRGGAPDGVQPAAGVAQAGLGRRRRRSRGRDHGRRRASCWPQAKSARSSSAGENVTAGYENNPKANGEAFVNGWFRTGDQGVIDDDGYLTLTGRLKEIINRGGEKISPREVDEALMDHPAVLQAVTFAMPHADARRGRRRRGRAARGPDAPPNRSLRAFLAERLAAFKMPRKILFLAEIPKGATGKLQRIGLAQKLGLA